MKEGSLDSGRTPRFGMKASPAAVFMGGLAVGLIAGMLVLQRMQRQGTSLFSAQTHAPDRLTCARVALVLNASDVASVLSFVNPTLGEASHRAPGSTFLGTRIPRRVVMTLRPSIDQLDPAQVRSMRSWVDEAGALGIQLVYYDESAARAFLQRHFPPVVVHAWDALMPGFYAYKADLFRYAELLVNGGVYADASCTLRAKLAELVGYNGSVVVNRTSNELWGGIFSAPPGSPWVAAALVRSVESIVAIGDGPVDYTGSYSLTRAYCSSRSCGEDLDHRSCEPLLSKDSSEHAGVLLLELVESRSEAHVRSPAQHLLASVPNPHFRAEYPVTQPERHGYRDSDRNNVDCKSQRVFYSITPECESLLSKVTSVAGAAAQGHRTFPGTRVPRRIVLKYNPPSIDDLIPALQVSANSWRDETGVLDVEVAYYDDATARAFLVQHYPKLVVDAWDALIPGSYRADLFRYAEIFIHGGVYVDIKCTRLADFSKLVGYNGTIVLDRDASGGLLPGFIAAPPRTPWVGQALTHTVRNVAKRWYGADPLDVTGPRCMCRAVCSWLGDGYSGDSCVFLRTAGILEQLGYKVLSYYHNLTDDAVRWIESPDGTALVTVTNREYRAAQINEPHEYYWQAWVNHRAFADSN